MVLIRMVREWEVSGKSGVDGGPQASAQRPDQWPAEGEPCQRSAYHHQQGGVRGAPQVARMEGIQPALQPGTHVGLVPVDAAQHIPLSGVDPDVGLSIGMRVTCQVVAQPYGSRLAYRQAHIHQSGADPGFL